MPFKSLAQSRLIAMKESKGELPKGTYDHWMAATPNFHKLPEHVKKASDQDGHGVWNCDQCGKYIRSCKCPSNSMCSDQKYIETCQDCRDDHVTKEASDINSLTRYIESAKKSMRISRPPRNSSIGTSSAGFHGEEKGSLFGAFHRGDLVRKARKDGIHVGDGYTGEERHLINKIGIAHEIFEHGHKNNGIRRDALEYGGHAGPAVIMREHNIVRSLTGPGSDGAKRFFTNRRNSGKINEAQNLKRHVGPEFQYGVSPKINSNERDMVESNFANKRLTGFSEHFKIASEHDHKDAWVANVIAPYKSGWIASLRPIDKRTKPGDFGTVGGKLDEGETALQAAKREANEEGWAIKGIHKKPIYISETPKGKIVTFAASGASKLYGHKERDREVHQITVSLDELAKSHSHNGFISKIDPKNHKAFIGLQKHADVAGGEPSQTFAQSDVGIEPPPPPQTDQAMAHTTWQAAQQNIAMKHMSQQRKPQLPPRRIPHNWIPR